jgi:putative sugar O-methyltransferase
LLVAPLSTHLLTELYASLVETYAHFGSNNTYDRAHFIGMSYAQADYFKNRHSILFSGYLRFLNQSKFSDAKAAFSRSLMLKPKLQHLRHPIRTFNVAKSMVAAHFEMRAFAGRGDRRFSGDPRYKLQNVTDGFVHRWEAESDDTAMSERICTAYIAAVGHPKSDQEMYRATGWWQEIRNRSLGPVRQALLTRNITALRGMYHNFFRDPCSTGLTAVPYGMTDVYFGSRIKDLHRRIYLSDALYRLDHWKQETSGRFTLSDLAIPEIGNPFGVCIEGTLVSARAEFQHYCAYRVASLLESKFSTVMEIGGGFGGMAYYMLRDQSAIKYLDFDLPESIALTTYYLMKAFPQKRFLLYGERPMTEEEISHADIVLMPLFEMKRLATASVDITFSSHAMADLEPQALASYLETIFRVTRRHFLFLGSALLHDLHGLIAKNCEDFHLSERRELRWNSHRTPKANEVECLYSINCANRNGDTTRKELVRVDR